MDCTFPLLALKKPSYDMTEVVDLSTRTSRIASSLIIPRQNHGMSVMKIGETFKLIAFGGESMDGGDLLDSIEVWNSQTETWEDPNSKAFKLKHKTSRFSTLTVFNGPKSAYSLNISTPKDEPRPFTPMEMYQGTDLNETRQFYLTCITPISVLLIVCLMCRLLPEVSWVILMSVAWYEMIFLTSSLSLSNLIGVKNSQKSIISSMNQLLISFNQPVIVLPTVFSQWIDLFKKTTRFCVIRLLPIAIGLPLFLYSRKIYFRLFKVELDKMYHETLQVILFLNFEKIHSALRNFNQLNNYLFLQQLTRIITNPIFALLIVTILMYSEEYLKIVSITIFFIHVISFQYYCNFNDIYLILKSCKKILFTVFYFVFLTLAFTMIFKGILFFDQ